MANEKTIRVHDYAQDCDHEVPATIAQIGFATVRIFPPDLVERIKVAKEKRDRSLAKDLFTRVGVPFGRR
jgi:hypothetical protein